MIRPSRNTRDRCTHAETTTLDVLELSTDDRKAADELWRAMRPVLAGCASPDEWDAACVAWRNYRPLPLAGAHALRSLLGRC